MKKAIAAIVLCVVLISCMSLSAFAVVSAELTGTYGNIMDDVIFANAYIRYLDDKTASYQWLEKYDREWIPAPGADAYLARFGKDKVNTPYLGFRLNFQGGNSQSLKIPAGYYFLLEVSGNDTITMGSTTEMHDYYFVSQVTDNVGNTYVSRTAPIMYTEQSKWYANLFFHIGDGSRDFEIKEILIESNLPSTSYGTMYYDVYLRMDVTPFPTAEQRNHEETLEAIQDSTDQITGSIGDAADNIINDDLGYQEDPDQVDAKNGIQTIKGKIDSLSNDISKSVFDFSASIDGLKTSIDSGKTFVWGWLDYVPVWVTAIIVGFAGILIARKVVK